MSPPTTQTSSMPPQVKAAPVDKTITVAATPERAFQVFTVEMSSWWPLVSHHIGKADAAAVVFEPFAGGRVYEQGVDGSECNWGRVLVWEPPARVVYTFDISHEWQADPSIGTEVEVRFTPVPGGTRVDLQHRLLERYGEHADRMREGFDGSGGWTSLLATYAERVESV